MGTKTVRAGICAVAFALPLLVYLLTLAREITFTDSGELAAVAATLGIAHPAGYPLFTLIGWLFSKLPVATVAFRVAMMSACAMAATSAVICCTGYRLITEALCARSAGKERSANGGAGDDVGSPGRPTSSPVAAGLAALAGALLFAFARTPWSQAVVVEVYALQALLVMLFLAACAGALNPSRDPLRAWPLVGLTAGLVLTNHLTGVLLIPSFVLALVLGLGWRPGARKIVPAVIWRTLLAPVLPLALYLYLPLRSRSSPTVSWRSIDTVHDFLVHVTARQYHGLWGSQGMRLEELSRFLTRQLPSEATLLFVALAALGLVAVVRRSPRVAAVSLVAMVAPIAYNMGYPIHDVGLFYVPVLAILSLWATAGAGLAVAWARRLHARAGFATAAALCLAALLPLGANWRGNDQRQFTLLAHYVNDSLRHLEPNAVVFSGRWDSFSSPALYYQAVAGVRPDVVVLDVGLLASPSLERRLRQLAPDLQRACEVELAAVREIARRAERGQSYDVTEGRARYLALNRKLVVEAVRLRPTYVTSDLYRQPMVRGYNIISEGLVARVAERDVFRPLPFPPFEGPGIGRAEIRSAREEEVFLDYRTALLNRAHYLRLHGREAEAAAHVEMASDLMR